MKPIGEIVQFQKRQEAKFICSRCGAERGCDCNAPAVEKLAELQQKNRMGSRERMRRKRERNQQLVTGNTDDWTDDEIEAAMGPLPSKEEKIVDDFVYLASIANRVALLDLTGIRITAEMKKVAKMAAEAWCKISREVNRG